MNTSNRNRLLLLLVFMTLCVSLSAQKATPGPGPDTSTAPAASPPLTKAQGDAIIEELRAIRTLLQQQNSAAVAPPPAAVSQDVKMPVRPGWYALGSDKAPVTVVEFTDYQCTFCRRFDGESFAKLKHEFIDTGKVRFVVRDLPLDFHSNAMIAAMAARCAGEQGRFWEMHDSMIRDKANDLGRPALLRIADETMLYIPQFTACLDSNKYKNGLDTDIADATGFGITGTPSFVIGKSDAKEIAGVRIEGAVPFTVFDSAIQKDLAPK